MGVLAQFRASRNLSRCLNATDLLDPDGRRSLENLRSIADAAIPSLFNRLKTAGDAELQRLREIMIYLLDDKSLVNYIPGLSSTVHPRVLSTTVRVLATSRAYDANHLLPLFDDDEVSKSALLKILEARKQSLSAAALLRKAYTLAPSQRVALFKIVEKIADESLVPELISRVTAQDVNTRLGVVRLLSKFNLHDTRHALMDRLNDRSPEVRLVALKALTRMGVKLDIDILCRLLRDGDMNVQNQAIDALVRLNDPGTVIYLVDLLKDESEQVRRAAVEVLNGMQYPDAVEDLLNALKDEDWWVRARAADALAKIGGRRVVEAVVKLIRSDDEQIRRAAIEILNSTKDEASMSHLIGALNDSDWWVRERAIDALASIGNRAAIPALLKLMRQDEQAAPIVLKAMRSLGDETHLKAILPMLGSSDENTVIEAMSTLAELVDVSNAEKVFKAIKRRAYTAGEDVRAAAKVSLKRINARLSRRAKQARAPKQAPRSPITQVGSPGGHINIRDLKAGDRLGDRYEFIRRVGKGAFSTVLLVKDTVVGEQIILKVLHDKMVKEEAMVKRFIREIRYARKINQMHVIRIYDFVAIDNIYAISMEYFPSVTLSSLLQKKKPLPIKQAIDIAAAVAAGIGAAHDVKVVHRDLKPGNILIDNEGLVKVVDFGIARAESGAMAETQLTKTGILIGTPRYMAPEQVTGKRQLDGRSDIYSLGVILYEMLTGQTAFKGDDNVQVLYKHVHGDIQPVHEVNAKIPEDLSKIVMKMMAVNPKRRYQTMEEVENALRSYRIERVH